MSEFKKYRFASGILPAFLLFLSFSSEAAAPYKGLFRVGNAAFEATGETYCVFPNADILKAMTGLTAVSGLTEKPEILRSQRSIGHCKFHGVAKKGTGIFYTDGISYCAYHNWNHYVQLSGKGGGTWIPNGEKYLKNLPYMGPCRFEGLFAFGGGGYHSNGTQYCHLSSWPEYVAWTKTWNLKSQPRLSESPLGQKNLRRACIRTPLLPVAKVELAENNLRLQYKVSRHVPMEMPSEVFTVGADTHHIFSTGHSVECAGVKGNPAKVTTPINADVCKTISISELRKFNNKIPLSEKKDWIRSYNGVFAANVIGKARKLYLIHHGENKNYRFPSGFCDQNTVNKVTCAECAAGLDSDGVWRDCAYAYSAFVSMSTREGLDPASNAIDFGPIAWPANGYVAADLRTPTSGGGLRHPKSIVHNGHLYLFYVDKSNGNWEEGRGPGIKVARAPIKADGTISPHSFRTAYNGAFVDPALPPRFSKENIRNFYQARGGRSTHIFGKKDYAKTYVSFTVAKIIGTKYFLGASLENGKVMLRISEDLVNWSPPTEVKELALKANPTQWWRFTPLLYASFLNKDGTRSDLIDLDDFYLVGTDYSPQDHVNSYRMRVRLVFPGLK